MRIQCYHPWHDRGNYRLATKAELVATLSALSLQSPLDRSATLLYWDTFATLFPKEAQGAPR
jgi:hypothetical protein